MFQTVYDMFRCALKYFLKCSQEMMRLVLKSCLFLFGNSVWSKVKCPVQSRTTNSICNCYVIVLKDIIIFWLTRLVVWWYTVVQFLFYVTTPSHNPLHLLAVYVLFVCIHAGVSPCTNPLMCVCMLALCRFRWARWYHVVEKTYSSML